jgi:hypothetical protein
MTIIPSKMYSGVEVQKIAGIKSRQYIAKYIKEGYLIALSTGKGQGQRYMIPGTCLKDFITRYKKGLTNGKKYTSEEIKKILEETISNL